jgi:Co/Zn/Cd efflux system component
MVRKSTVLKVVAALNALITTVQIIFALSISSLALLADGLQMATDTLTYMVSLYAESQRMDPKRGKAIELGAVGFSVVALISVSTYVVQDAITTIKNPTEVGVNMYVVLTFACLGLLFDAIEVAMFLSSDKYNEHDLNSGKSKLNEYLLDHDHAPEGNNNVSDSVSDGELNIKAAFLHVAGDTLRSASNLITSLAVIVGGADSTRADAYCALVICVTLVVAGLCMCPTIAARYAELQNSSSPAKRDVDHGHDQGGAGGYELL